MGNVLKEKNACPTRRNKMQGRPKEPGRLRMPLHRWRPLAGAEGHSSDQLHGVSRVAAVWNVALSSFYAARQHQQQPREPKKRGPKVHSDEGFVGEIRQFLAEPAFAGEGYRKSGPACVTGGVRTAKDRVLRLLREHHLLSPSPSRR